ncbi:MAG: GDSL-type esterase/lipase family protein [Janthinobacterium lividum]
MNYVALGDSYASGEGLAPNLAYPVLLRERSEERFAGLVSGARSGAVTGDVVGSQVGALRDTTSTVTLTVGGNDVGFASVLAACLRSPDPRLQAVLDSGGAGWRRQLRAGAEQRIAYLGGPAAVPQGRSVPLVRVLSDVARRAPDAEILVTGYPRLLGDRPTSAGHRASDTLPLFVGPEDAAWLSAQSDALDAAVAAAVERAQASGVRARFVDVSATFAGHALSDTGTPGVNGVVLASATSLVPDSSSFHLTAWGQAAYASALASAVGDPQGPDAFLSP